MGARQLARHAPRCFEPRTLERMLEVLGVDTTADGCWFTPLEGTLGPPTAYPKLQGRRVTRWVVILRDGVDPTDTNTVGRHTCDDALCVRPDHILSGTRGDNTRDAVARGQQQYGAERSTKIWATRRANGR